MRAGLWFGAVAKLLLSPLHRATAACALQPPPHHLTAGPNGAGRAPSGPAPAAARGTGWDHSAARRGTAAAQGYRVVGWATVVVARVGGWGNGAGSYQARCVGARRQAQPDPPCSSDRACPTWLITDSRVTLDLVEPASEGQAACMEARTLADASPPPLRSEAVSLPPPLPPLCRKHAEGGRLPAGEGGRCCGAGAGAPLGLPASLPCAMPSRQLAAVAQALLLTLLPLGWAWVPAAAGTAGPGSPFPCCCRCWCGCGTPDEANGLGA